MRFAELPLVWLSGGESKGFKMRFILWGLEHRESDGGEEAHLGEIIETTLYLILYFISNTPPIFPML
ncbi:MAG TPA: hypothetical protein DEP19_07365 [Anaerolineae bacterium]|nr:hypothetical protein [Anaerolineae bacterium]